MTHRECDHVEQLLRFDEDRRRVVVGLIDYLHQFDFLKKMESTSKASLTFRNPTVISPMSYRRRFLNAMHRYFFGIERELEVRVRKRAGTASNKLGHPPRLMSGSRASEVDHSGVAKQLAKNLELSESARAREGSSSLRRATRSEMAMPQFETRWTSEKPRGHSISTSSRRGKVLHATQSLAHSEGDECSPCSVSSGGGFYSSEIEEGDENASPIGMPLSPFRQDRALSR